MLICSVWFVWIFVGVLKFLILVSVVWLLFIVVFLLVVVYGFDFEVGGFDCCSLF